MPYNQITLLISELLYKHDCVIVPNLGGFVAQGYSAHFTKGNNLLLPPTKHVLFNKNLKHNDGLLVSAFADKFGVSYTDANAQIEDYKTYLLALLQAKKRFELNNLGLLYIDNDNEIRFESKIDVNFLIDSFGFEPILANEIEQNLEPRIVKPVFEDRKVIIENKSGKKYSVKQMALLAVGLPITMALLIFAANSKPMQPIMQSSLNPFYSAPKNYIPSNYNNNKAFYLSKIAKPDLIADANGNAIFRLSANGTPLVATINTVDVIKINETKIDNSINLVGKYQVVVGCFGKQENAKKLIKELKSKHISSAISGINAKGLFVVSCGGFNQKSLANDFVTKLKTDLPSAWIMTK